MLNIIITSIIYVYDLRKYMNKFCLLKTTMMWSRVVNNHAKLPTCFGKILGLDSGARP